MVITTTHIKGGVGKSTLTILLAKVLSAAGYKILVIDMDYRNNSISYYFNSEFGIDLINEKNIFNVFNQQSIENNIIKINDNIDFIHSHIKLKNYKNTEYFRLKKILKPIKDKYDYILIDTNPSDDSLESSTYYASDKLIIPTFMDIYCYQATEAMIGIVNEHEIQDLKIHIAINRYEAPKSNAKEDSYSVQIYNLFMEQADFKDYYLSNKIIDSKYIKQAIDNKDFKIKNSGDYKRVFECIKSFVEEIIEKEINLEVI